MTKSYFIFLLCALYSATSSTPPATAAGIELNVRHTHFASWDTVTTENHVDFDGDGRPDIVFTNPRSSGTAIEVFGLDGQNTWQRKQAFFARSTGSNSGPLTWTEDGESYLGIAGENGLAILSGWPLVYQRTLLLKGETQGTSNMTIADIDGDGRAEVVTRYRDSLSIHSIDDGRVLWSIKRPDWRSGGRPLVAQLDNDPALEIVVPSASGLSVIDGATRSIYEHASDAYDSSVLFAGRFFPDGSGVLHTGLNWSLYRTNPWQTEWTNYWTWWPDVSVGDLDGDGVDEIVSRITQFGMIEITEAQSRQTRYVPTPYTAALAVADIDGDGRAELISREWRGDDMVTVVRDGVTFEATSTPSHDATGFRFVTPFVANAASPRTDIYRHSYRADAHIQRINALNDEVMWSVNHPENWDTLRHSVSAITPIEHGIDGIPEIMLSLSRMHDHNQLSFFDAVDGSHKRSLTLSGEETWAELRDSVIVHDAQGKPKSIITCTSAARIQEYNYFDGSLLWTSTGNGAKCERIWNTRSGDIVIQTNLGLAGFDGVTRQRSWSIDQEYIRGIWLIDPNDEAEQFLIRTEEGSLKSYDTANGQHIRTIAPPTGPGEEFYGEIVAIPGRGIRHLLTHSNGVLHIMDGTSGESLARIEDIGASGQARYSLAVTPIGTDSYLVSAISEGSYWTLDLHFPPDAIFSNSFESLH